MTLTLDRADQDRPLVADAPLDAPVSSGDELPDDYDATRDFFNGCTVSFDLPRYVFPLGPPSPMSRTLADVVSEVAGP